MPQAIGLDKKRAIILRDFLLDNAEDGDICITEQDSGEIYVSAANGDLLIAEDGTTTQDRWGAH